MISDRTRYIFDRIRQAKLSGETDTKFGSVLTKWKDIHIPIQRDGKWLLEGLIMDFKKQLEILSAIDPTISRDLPPHLLDPVQIAHFWGIPLEEFNGPPPQATEEDGWNRQNTKTRSRRRKWKRRKRRTSSVSARIPS